MRPRMELVMCFGCPNGPSSATRPAGRVDCNHSAMAGFAAAHGWAHGTSSLGNSLVDNCDSTLNQELLQGSVNIVNGLIWERTCNSRPPRKLVEWLWSGKVGAAVARK